MSRGRSLPVILWCVAMAGILPALSGEAHSPYAEEESREIKALSPEEIRGLLEGRGLGMARAAELNSHPGPKHVLELAGPLGLTDRQAERARSLYEAMHARVVDLGRRIVDSERRLDALFRSTSAGGTSSRAGEMEPEVASLVLEIARLRGETRLAHLRAHLGLGEALTPDQIAAYDRLRGYRGDGDEMPADCPHGGSAR